MVTVLKNSGEFTLCNSATVLFVCVVSMEINKRQYFQSNLHASTKDFQRECLLIKRNSKENIGCFSCLSRGRGEGDDI